MVSHSGDVYLSRRLNSYDSKRNVPMFHKMGSFRLTSENGDELGVVKEFT